MPSSAKSTFDENCKDVTRLINIHKNIAGDKPGRKFGVEVLNKSAIVLICAYWEAYIEDVVAEALHAIADRTVDPSKLPLDLRKFIAKAVKQDSHNLSPWDLACDGWKVVLKSNLSKATSTYLSSWHSPKSQNIRDLFQRALGLADLPSNWQRSWLSAAKATQKLDDFVTLRGAIAHRGKAAESIKKWMAGNSLDHVKELVLYTDDATNAHVHAVTGQSLF